MLFPFIPQISKGLNLSILAFSYLLTIRTLPNLLSPIIGVLTDQFSRRMMMSMALAMRAISLLGIMISSGWWSIPPMLLNGLSTTLFLPATRAYISDQAIEGRRGRALASVNIAYAFAGIIGFPLVGLSIDLWGWRLPFFVQSILCIMVGFFVWATLPKTEQRSFSNGKFASSFHIFFRSNVIASLGVGFLSMMSLGIINTLWGIWFSTEFKLSASSIGSVATIFGLAEFAGITMSILFVDRFGARRSSIGGLGTCVAILAFLLFYRNDFTTVLIIMTAFAIVIQYTNNALIPLYAVQVPEAPASIFSIVTLGIAIGLGIGSPISSSLWNRYGLNSVILSTVAILSVTCFLVKRFLKE